MTESFPPPGSRNFLFLLESGLGLEPGAAADLSGDEVQAVYGELITRSCAALESLGADTGPDYKKQVEEHHQLLTILATNDQPEAVAGALRQADRDVEVDDLPDLYEKSASWLGSLMASELALASTAGSKPRRRRAPQFLPTKDPNSAGAQANRRLKEAYTLDEKLELVEAWRGSLGHDPYDSFESYMSGIKTLPLLRADEEVELAKRIERGLFATTRLQATGEITSLPLAERRQLIADLRQIQTEGEQATTLLYLGNVRLVVSLAMKYSQARHMKLLDRIQEGNIGLLEAVKKFDYTKGTKFSTYAVWWIRQGIVRSLANYDRAIRIPVHLLDSSQSLSKKEEALKQVLGRQPTSAELAAKTGISQEKIKQIEQAHAQQPISFDQPVGDTKVTVREMLAQTPDPQSVETAIEETQLIAELLSSLPVLDRKIILLTYFQGHSNEEVAQMLRLGQSYVKNIAWRALKSMRSRAIGDAS